MKKIAFFAFTDKGIAQAVTLQKQFPKSLVLTSRVNDFETVSTLADIDEYLAKQFHQLDGICFIGAMGICVRKIAPFIQDKQTDPAVICVDEQGVFVQSVLSGHIGGGNDFTRKVAQILGAQPVISTASDLQGIWSLDTLAKTYNWTTKSSVEMNTCMALFVNNKKTALLLDIKDAGTEFLERSLPDFVDVFYKKEALDSSLYELIIVVSPQQYDFEQPTLSFIPKVLHIGSGCRKSLDDTAFEQRLQLEIAKQGYHFEAIAALGSIDIKSEQSAYKALSEKYQIPFKTFSSEEINTITVPNPSETVQSKTGVDGVSESTALLLSGNNRLLVEKFKVHLENDEKFTFAIALSASAARKASIAIIGAGPGNEELITIKGKQYLETADCVLYAGSLIPEEMTNWCKPTAVVRNSATMTLEEQINLMKEHYAKGNSIVRLQSGDPSLYGAIQEQMTIFDELGMDYFIVPGISAFSAGAAVLKSEFTIPEVVQSIVLTRGEGKTPMPSKESISNFAKTNATMCIFLSAGIAGKVEKELLEHFDPNTPVAVMYRISWKDEEIYQGKLHELAKIVKESKKTRTVLIIVGHAIGARKNRSQLYSPEWKHIFRTNKKFVVEDKG